jgi:hypothetical protein
MYCTIGPYVPPRLCSAFNMVTGQKIMPELVSGLDSGLLAATVVTLLAVLVAVFTRGRLGYKPERAARPTPLLPAPARKGRRMSHNEDAAPAKGRSC